MRIFSCESPQVIINPYTHEKLKVRCGKCRSCLNFHAKLWIDRLENERRCWRYAYMVTLTYDNMHLPVLHDDGRGNLVDFKNADVCIPFSELDIKTSRDFNYLNSRLKHFLGLPYQRIDYLQKFHKRLNKYIHDNITQKFQNFRYFVVTEYGKDTLRTHHHGIYFFNDQRIAANFKEILFKNWQYSDNVQKGVDAVPVLGSAASYVAQYINAFSSLPSFYKHRAFAPKFICSKRPPIGSLAFDESEKEIFFRESPVRVAKSLHENKFVVVPLAFSLRNRLFPKIPRYFELSLYGRVALYGLCRELDCWSFSSFCTFLKERYKDRKESFMWKRIKSECYIELVSYLKWLTNNFKFSVTDYVDEKDFKSIQERVKRFYYVVNRVTWQADSFGISIFDYVRHMDNFYNNLTSFKLKHFYEQQENYTCASHDVEDLSYMYVDPDVFLFQYEYEYKPVFEDTFGFKDIRTTAEKIYRDSTKTHFKNDYLDKCKDVKLSLIMKNYFDVWQKM